MMPTASDMETLPYNCDTKYSQFPYHLFQIDTTELIFGFEIIV